MIEFWYNFQLVMYLAVAAIALIMTLFSKSPGPVVIISQAAVFAALAVQLLLSTILVVSGQRAETSTVEFFGYLIVAMIVPVAAVLWALYDKGRWSNTVLGLSALTVSVMLIRMQQLWTGISPI